MEALRTEPDNIERTAFEDIPGQPLNMPEAGHLPNEAVPETDHTASETLTYAHADGRIHTAENADAAKVICPHLAELAKKDPAYADAALALNALGQNLIRKHTQNNQNEAARTSALADSKRPASANKESSKSATKPVEEIAKEMPQVPAAEPTRTNSVDKTLPEPSVIVSVEKASHEQTITPPEQREPSQPEDMPAITKLEPKPAEKVESSAPAPVVTMPEAVQREIVEQVPRAEAEQNPELNFVTEVPVEAVQNLTISQDGPETALVVEPLNMEAPVAAEAEPELQEPQELLNTEVTDSIEDQPELTAATELDTDGDMLFAGEAPDLPLNEEEPFDGMTLAEDNEALADSDTDLEPAGDSLEAADGDVAGPEYETPRVEVAATDVAPETPPLVWDAEADEPVEVPAVVARPVVQLNEMVPQLDTESARDVHRAAKEAEALIEEVMQEIGAAAKVETEAEPGAEAGPAVEISEETVEQLVEAVRKVYIAAGIGLEPDAAKQLVYELLNKTGSDGVSEEDPIDDRFAERGTLEKLQWFQSYLKNLKWQTNPVHLFLGKYALTSASGAQAAQDFAMQYS